MKFGVFIPQGWRHDLLGIEPEKHWAVMSELAQHVDADPRWSSLWVYDHFHTVPVPSEEATHEAWTLMAAFAAVTSRVRIGQMCTCMSYRSPTYLAKVAATVDHVSGGRLEMGIGGGWYEHEWRAYGYGFPSAGERLGRLREGVEIFRQAWTTGTATLDGKHYQVEGALFHPLPLQRTSPRNNIPMWIAGGGEQLTLRVAAEYADYTNFDGRAKAFAAKSEILRRHCDTVGRDFDAIVRSSNYNVFIGETEAEAEERVSRYVSRLGEALGRDAAAEYADKLRKVGLVGTPEQLVERLAEVQGLGMTYAIVNFPHAAYDRDELALFAEAVIPELAG